MDLHKDNSTWSKVDCQMSADLMSRFAAFMRSGTPNSHGSTFVWSEYSYASDRRGVFNFMKPEYSKSFRDYRSEKVEFWSKYLFGDSKLHFAEIETDEVTEEVTQPVTEEKPRQRETKTTEPTSNSHEEPNERVSHSKDKRDEL